LQKGRKGFETYLKNGCWENETEFAETGYSRATNGAAEDLYWFIDEQGASVRKVPKNASRKTITTITVINNRAYVIGFKALTDGHFAYLTHGQFTETML